MAIINLFSKRMRRLRGEAPDAYTYNSLPSKLRVQIIHIWRDTVGTPALIRDFLSDQPFWNPPGALFWVPINKILKRERGEFTLHRNSQSDPEVEIANYFLQQKDIEQALDVVEIVFRHLQNLSTEPSRYYNYQIEPQAAQDAIDELNGRFHEHGVGYQFENGQIIRVDSQFLHTEAVKPALHLLRDQAFNGPNDEFMRAHNHYRHQRYKECLTECLKAFESTMKAICDRQGWAYDKDKSAATALIDICLKEGLIPGYLQSEFTALAAVLKAGLPTVRNKRGGHGQGSQIVAVPAYLASYALHLTAANILLLVEAEQEIK